MAPKWWLRLRSPDQQNRVADDAVRGNAKRAFAGIHPTRSPTSNSAARPDRNLMRGLGNPGAPFELDGAPQRRMTSMTRLPADNRLPHPAPLDCSRLCMPSRQPRPPCESQHPASREPHPEPRLRGPRRAMRLRRAPGGSKHQRRCNALRASPFQGFPPQHEGGWKMPHRTGVVGNDGVPHGLRWALSTQL
ncbi:hypothetical protein ABID08_004844 [Rhizobium binae]|uniref:Uncharacterized protein n=1 Tax=Rhizobium binae TaxID=1138190 RepID=A0ABV2MLX9_9HYPH